MASGDVVLEVTGSVVISDSSARLLTSAGALTNNSAQTSHLSGGTQVVPAVVTNGLQFTDAVINTGTQYSSGVVVMPETVFDSTKKYTITITET